MKFTKTLCMILALCMILTVCSMGVLSASAADEEPAEVGATYANGDFTMPTLATVTAGGWEFSDIALNDVTAEEKDILAKALEGLVGVSYEAKTVIATQTVAGKNYAFLCVATPATADSEPYWTVVVVYADLQGNTELTCINTIDPAFIATLENLPEIDSGAWASAVKENGVVVNEAVSNAFMNYTGVDLLPIAVLGTQLVSGTNYRMLAYGTTVTATPVSGLYVVDVYVNLEGGSEITSVKAFDLNTYVSAPAPVEPEEDPTEEDPTEAEEEGEKSPQTGHTSGVALAIVLVMIAMIGAGVSVYTIAKKRG